jgi:putative thioredoxin
MLNQLSDEQKKETAISRAQSAITIAAESKTPDELEGLRNAYAQNPEDGEAAFALANTLFAGGMRDEAADILLASIAHDRDWNEGAARSRLLEIFELVGLTDPWTAQNRRKLSAILFG